MWNIFHLALVIWKSLLLLLLGGCGGPAPATQPASQVVIASKWETHDPEINDLEYIRLSTAASLSEWAAGEIRLMLADGKITRSELAEFHRREAEKTKHENDQYIREIKERLKG